MLDTTINNDFNLFGQTVADRSQTIVDQLGKTITDQLATIAGCACSPTSITAITTISAPGHYCLANAIEANGDTGPLVITSNNVLLDLNGYTISNRDTAGISIGTQSGITIKNGNICAIDVSSSNIGIALTESTGVKIVDMFNYRTIYRDSSRRRNRTHCRRLTVLWQHRRRGAH